MHIVRLYSISSLVLLNLVVVTWQNQYQSTLPNVTLSMPVERIIVLNTDASEDGVLPGHCYNRLFE